MFIGPYDNNAFVGVHVSPTRFSWKAISLSYAATLS